MDKENDGVERSAGAARSGADAVAADQVLQLNLSEAANSGSLP